MWLRKVEVVVTSKVGHYRRCCSYKINDKVNELGAFNFPEYGLQDWWSIDG